MINSRILTGLFALLVVSACVTQPGYRETTSDGTFVVTRMNGGQPIVTEAMFKALGAGDREGKNMNGMSAIRIPDWIPPADRADPGAVYYLYFAHHQGKYIRMAWAAKIDGPWTLYDVGAGVEPGDRGVVDLGGKPMPIGNGIVLADNHIASPNAHVDDANQRIILYFHSGSRTSVDGEVIDGQRSFVATSDNGLEFAGDVEPVILGNSYFNIFHYNGNTYALDNGATLFKAPDANNPWQAPPDWDFRNNLWVPFGSAYQADINADGYEFSTLRVRHVSTWVKGDTLYTFYSRRGATPPERLMMSTTDLSASDNHEEWDPSYPPEEIYRAQPGWEGGHLEVLPSESGSSPEDVNQLRDPCLFEDADGELYLFYTGAGEDALGVIHLEPT